MRNRKKGLFAKKILTFHEYIVGVKASYFPVLPQNCSIELLTPEACVAVSLTTDKLGIIVSIFSTMHSTPIVDDFCALNDCD